MGLFWRIITHKSRNKHMIWQGCSNQLCSNQLWINDSHEGGNWVILPIYLPPFATLVLGVFGATLRKHETSDNSPPANTTNMSIWRFLLNDFIRLIPNPSIGIRINQITEGKTCSSRNQTSRTKSLPSQRCGWALRLTRFGFGRCRTTKDSSRQGPAISLTWFWAVVDASIFWFIFTCDSARRKP